MLQNRISILNFQTVEYCGINQSILTRLSTLWNPGWPIWIDRRRGYRLLGQDDQKPPTEQSQWCGYAGIVSMVTILRTNIKNTVATVTEKAKTAILDLNLT